MGAGKAENVYVTLGGAHSVSCLQMVRVSACLRACVRLFPPSPFWIHTKIPNVQNTSPTPQHKPNQVPLALQVDRLVGFGCHKEALQIAAMLAQQGNQLLLHEIDRT